MVVYVRPISFLSANKFYEDMHTLCVMKHYREYSIPLDVWILARGFCNLAKSRSHT